MIDLGKVTEATKLAKAVGVPDHLITPDIFIELPNGV